MYDEGSNQVKEGKNAMRVTGLFTEFHFLLICEKSHFTLTSTRTGAKFKSVFVVLLETVAFQRCMKCSSLILGECFKTGKGFFFCIKLHLETKTILLPLLK